MRRVLDNVDYPADLADLSPNELTELAGELRTFLVDKVSKTGGHLAANLGVVELTVSLLKVFGPPSDKIVWDVSHQAYVYKILTGRKDKFDGLRQYGGISGFLRRDESEFDAFGAGHAGTALSAGLGMAVARDRREGKEHVVVVIGDGSSGCGIALEAFNNLASATGRMIVVLNDNEMSIAANVGAMSRYLGSLLASPRYNRWKRSVESFASKLKMGWFRSMYYRIEEAVKSLFLRSVIFEEFGLRYIGPIDGHDIPALLDALAIARDSDRPIILHVSTQKGKGYSFAEAFPEKWHGTSPFDVQSGLPLTVVGSPSYSSVFGSTLERLAEEDSRIMAITAAMPAGTGLSRFAERFPGRFFDVGMSEEHAAVFAAGLAASGCVPVFAVYSTFVQRSIDCIIHDICLQNLPVILCLDRAGIVGDDGPTHHGVFDIALLRPVPGLVIMQPKDEAELANMLFTAVGLDRPVVIRYPRGCGPGAAVPSDLARLAVGEAEITKSPGSATVWIWATGDMVPLATDVADLLDRAGHLTGVVNARFIRPLDEQLLVGHAQEASVIATIENGVVTGGFGAGVQECVAMSGTGCRTLKFGWPDEFIPHGSQARLMMEYGLTAENIAHSIERHVVREERGHSNG